MIILCNSQSTTRNSNPVPNMDRESQLDTHCQHQHRSVETERVQLLLFAQTLYVQPRHCHCSTQHLCDFATNG